jgi:D-glycero-D-manno-heptose 1,7-bisphosphate phosphatase
MRRPAVFFDRDNTLIVCDGYLGEASKVVLVNGAPDAIARARRLGYAIVVFSNQSGVARGMFTEEDVHAVNTRLDELLADANPAAVIDRHEFCPFHPDGVIERYRKDSPLRKPAPGMILQATEKLALDLSRSWVIGDAPRDIEAGKAAGCRTILFHHPDLSASPAQKSDTTVLPDHFVESLKEAVNIIEKTPDVEAPPVEEEAAASGPVLVDLSNLEKLVGDVLEELRKPRQPVPLPALAHSRKFSISKLFAGIVQMLALATLLLSYWAQSNHLQTFLLLAIMLQLFTIALLLMDRQQ